MYSKAVGGTHNPHDVRIIRACVISVVVVVVVVIHMRA